MASRSIDQSGILDADGTLPAEFVVADNLANLSVTARTIDPSVTTDEITEGIANLYYTDNRARLAITVTGGGYYDNANGIITIGGTGLNTTNVIEGANLYFTNARARAAISNIDSTIEYNPVTGTIRANVIALGFGENVVTVQGQTGVVTLTTTDLPEGANLYFSNTRAQVAIRAGLGISMINGQVNVNPNANLIINEVSTSKLTVYEPGNTVANIELVYDNVSKALIINSNISPLTNETYNLGTVGETFNDLYVRQIYANNITLSNTITADEFIGNVTGDLTKFILVSADNNSLLIDQSSNPDLFLPKGTKARVDLSSDTLIGIGFDIGQYNAANNDIANGANLSGLSYYVNNQLVTGFTDWAASFNDANARSIVYSIPQSAPFNLIYYSLQFTEWRGNITVAPPTDTDDLREGSLNFYYTDQRVDDRLFQVADGNVGLIFDQGTSLLTLAQDISTDAGVIFDNVTANAFYGNAFYGTLYGNIIGQLTDLNGLTTTELPEGANAYFTVSRVRTNVNAQNGITYSSITGMFELEPTNVIANFGNANIVYGNPNSTITIQVDEWGRIENVINRGIIISSSNVLEGANLFFTNARVVANVSNLSVNVLADVDTTGASAGQALVWNGSNWIPQTTITANITGVANIANLVVSLSNHTTSNLNEGANLYFTNARVRAAVGAADTSIIYYEANGNFQANVSALASGVTSVNGQNGIVILTTANIAESGNLYFTNERVWSNVGANLGYLWSNISSVASGSGLTTSNIAEGANLYFTNARVYSALYNSTSNTIPVAFQSIFVQDGAANGIKFDSPNALDYANISTVTSGGATYFTFYVGDNTQDLFKFYAPANSDGIQFNDNVIWHAGNDGAGSNLDADLLDGQQGSFYASNAYVDSRTTTNIAEGANLYFTNTRVRAAVGTADSTIIYYEANGNFQANVTALASGVSSVNGQTGTVVLTTANIAESSNLYFDNTRARAAVGTANSTSLVYYEANGNFQVNVEAISSVTSVNGQTGTVVLTTANIAEGANLYFTDERVWSNVGANIGNLNSWLALHNTTTGITEGTNLYFTNTRSRAAITGGTGVTYTEANGQISIGQSVAPTNDVEFRNIVITGNLLVQGTETTINATELAISDNMIYLNEAIQEALANAVGDGSNVVYTTVQTHGFPLGTVVRVTGITPANLNQLSYATILAITANTFTIAKSNTDLYVSGGNAFGKSSINPDLGWSGGYNDGTYHHAGMFRDATDGVFKIFDNYAPEPDSNIYIDTAHVSFRLANLMAKEFIGPVIGNVSSLDNHTTSNLIEGANLYFNNTRARAAVGAVGSNLVYYEANGNFQVIVSGGGGAVDSVNGLTGTVVLTTSNIAEGANLYFTDNRVWANVGANIGNLNAWTDSNSSNIGNLNSWVSSNSSNIGNLNSWVANHNTTTGIAEGTNLYFTNTKARAAVGAVGSNLVYYETNGNFQVIVTGGGGGGAVDSVNGQTGTVVLTTANITEDTNLYFTNTRARAAITTATANAKGLSYVESIGEFSLADSGATAAVYGGATQIPAVVVDRYGRITAASNVATSGSSGTVTGFNFTGGIISVANPNTVPSLTVAGTSGGIVYFSSSSAWASSGTLTNQALVVGGGAGSAPSTITTGTGVVSALGVAVGSSGAFVVNGGALGTPSSGTVTNLSGTASININGTVGATTPNSGAFTTISASGTVTALGALNVTGVLTSNSTVETVTALSGATGTVTHDTSGSAIFYHTSPAANFTANFTNVPTVNNRVINVALVIQQGVTPYICNAVQINSVSQTIRWQGGSAPTGTASRWEVMNFSLIYTGSTWYVLGALFSHG